MSTISLSILNSRINKEFANTLNLIYINKNPDFQRDYEPWDERLKTRFVETMLIGRAMNPLWTILNPEDNSEEVLDGMHRITTAVDFLNDKFCLSGKHFTTDSYVNKYDKKYFKELSPDDQAKVRNYNFMINSLDSTYRTNIEKRRDMYEILNRSSRTLNVYEYNKVLYNPFYEIIVYYKEKFKNFIRKKDSRGTVESEIISFLPLSSELPNSWSSITDLKDKYLKINLGESEESVSNFLKENTDNIKETLEFLMKIIKKFEDAKLLDTDFKRDYILYKFLLCRLCFKLKNISIVNRHINDIIKDFKQQVLDVEIQQELKCPQRNSLFQKKYIILLDKIIDNYYDPYDTNNRRLFNKITIIKKLKEQNNKCNICSKILANQYEGDHINEWSKGGKTDYDNLQVLCLNCHRKKGIQSH